MSLLWFDFPVTSTFQEPAAAHSFVVSDDESIASSTLDLDDYLLKSIADPFSDGSTSAIDGGLQSDQSATGKQQLLNFIDQELFASLLDWTRTNDGLERDDSEPPADEAGKVTGVTVNPSDYAPQVSPRFVSRFTPSRSPGATDTDISSSTSDSIITKSNAMEEIVMEKDLVQENNKEDALPTQCEQEKPRLVIRLKSPLNEQHVQEPELPRKRRLSESETASFRDEVKSQKRTFACVFPGCTIAPFARKYNRDQHYKTHLNVKEFICRQCGKTFARNYDVNRHMKTVHTHKT